MKSIAVIGAGPAGMIAAGFAKTPYTSVTLFDRNEKVGKKLFLTGKGRCNITNTADKDGFLRSIPRNPRFLYSAFDGFFNQDIIDLIESEGVPTKVERGGRVFPQSDKSSDVIKALRNHVNKLGVVTELNSKVTRISRTDDKYILGFEGGRELRFDAVIIAAGGMSYPSTGSDGDGYRFAEAFGHTVTALKPSLTALTTFEKWPGELAGLSLKNVVLKVSKDGKEVFRELGEMLFTHSGVSGPLVLSASARIADSPENAKLFIDMKPALEPSVLEARVLRDLEEKKHKQMKNVLLGLLPSRMVPVVLDIAGIDPEKTTDSFTKSERKDLVSALKSIPLTVSGTAPIAEAIITRGGVSVKEIDPKTMESKLSPGLYFAGEVIDVDAYTGGFNLQIAYSTGAAAGRAAARN